MSSACISIHRKKRWCCVATRNHNVRCWRAYSVGLAAGHRAYQDHNARLYSSWNFDFVCCAKLSGGEIDHNHLRTTPASGMAGWPGTPDSTCTSRQLHSSWLNLVERFFRDLTDQIVGGSFVSVKELADRIFTYLADRNQNPKRYVWNAKGEEILRQIQRARNAMMQSQAAV